MDEKTSKLNQQLMEDSMSILEMYIIGLEESNDKIDEQISQLNAQKAKNAKEITKLQKVLNSSAKPTKD